MKKVLSLIALVLGISAFSSLYAQNSTTLRFTGQGRQGAYVQLSSVEVKNLTRGWEETLVYPDTILMLGNVGLEDHVSISRFALSQNTPNPFRGSTDFSLQMPEADRVSISVFDINGKKITDLTQDLTEGIHIFRVILNTPQTYIVTAKTEYHSATIKIINQGSEAYNRVVYLGMGSGSITYEMGGNKNLTTDLDFEPGDLMSYVGKYVANGVEYTSDTVLQPQYQSQDFQLLFPCVPLNVNMFSATTCDGFTWNGQTYTQSGTYTQTFQGTDGCDSVVTLNLTVQQPVSSTVSVTVCGSYAWNGQTYTQSGIYTQTYQAANGCDSVVTLNLTVNQPTSSELSATTCGSFTWNGQTLTQSGTYSQTLQDVNGCDSVATLHLTITPPVTNSIAASACGSYVWNGQTYTQSGTYTQTLQTVNGCDSVVTLNLTVGVMSLPTLSAVQVYGVSAHAANVTASVLSDGCSPVVSQGFCWGTQPDPVVSGSHADCPVGMAMFFSALSGLEAGQTYYVRAYATNALGTAYSPSATFTTAPYLSFGLLVDTPCTSDSVPVSHSTEVLEYCVGTDSVRLSIGNYEYGIVQWQVSHDTVEWTNIKDANDTFYVFYPEESGYYRARMTYNQCPSEYSQTIHLHLIPRADAGRDRVLNADYSAQLFGNEFEDATGLWTVLSGDSAVIDDPTDPYALFQGPDSLYVLTWTLTNSCGSSTDTVTLRFIHTVLADHIVVVDTTDLILSDSAEMANGLYRIVFNYPVPTIVDSTILVGIPNGGFLRKVVSFEQQGDTAVMYTQQATLDDLIEEGAFNFDGSMLNNAAISGAKGPKALKGYARLDHQPTRAELAENPDFLDGRVWYYEYPLECSVSDGSKSGSLKFPFLPGDVDTNFTPSLKFTDFHASPDFVTDFDFYKTNGGVHTYYLNEFRMPVSFILKLKASFSVHADIYEFEKNFFTIKKPIIFMIGVVPVEISAKYQLVGGLEGDAEISVQKTWYVTGVVEIGQELRYDQGEITLIVSKPHLDFESLSPWTVNATTDFSFSLKNKISLELYGCLGPYAEIGPKMNFKNCFPITSAENASREFTFDIPWKIGISMKAFKRKVFDLNYKGIFDKIYEKKDPDRLEKCTVAPQNYDMGGGVYHPVSFKVYGDLTEFLLSKLNVHVHCSSGHIEGYNQAFQSGHTWNKTTIDTMVSPGQLVDIYWKPDGAMPAVVEVYVYDCDGEHIDGSPIICFATVGNNPCLQSNLQLSVVNGQLQASGGQQPYQYSDDGVNYSYMKPTLVPNHTYYVKDLNNCMAQYKNPSVACEIQMDYSLNGGSAAVVVRNGSAPYRFYLDGSSTPFVTSPILPGVTIPLSNGGHTITVVDKNDCTCTVHFTIDNGQSIPTVYVNPTYNTHNNVWNKVQGIVVDDGNLDVTERGIYYSANQNMSSATKVVGPLGQGTGTFLCSVPASVAQSSYYVYAYAVNSQGTGYSDTVLISGHNSNPSQSGQPCPGTPTVTDYDGNVYNTVQIGQQCWMKENLRTTHYADGTGIPAGGSNMSYTQPYYYDYSSSVIPLVERGLLYNWSAVMKGETNSTSVPSGVQGVCPTGWHVPSDMEWVTMEQTQTSMDVSGDMWRGDHAGRLAGGNRWYSSSNDYAPGNMSYSDRNVSGFSIVPAGWFSSNIHYVDAGSITLFWSSTEASSGYDAYTRTLNKNYASVCRTDNDKRFGFSVRCVLGEGGNTVSLPTVITNTVSNIMSTSAICGGNVTDDGGLTVTACGVCWSTSHNPTISDNHTSDGSGTGSFTGSITGLTSGTTYYVRAYATNSVGTAYGSEVSLTTAVFTPTEFTCGISTVTDHEGNEYHTVKIGNQCWTKENMRCVTSPSTGTNIVNTLAELHTYTGKMAKWYNNDQSAALANGYGLLYNWNAAVDTFNVSYGETSLDTNRAHAFSVTFNGHRRGICPEGWHVPTDAEWTALTNYLSSENGYACGGNGDYIAKAMASQNGWNISYGNCMVGCSPSANNASGFNALPAGIYSYELNEIGEVSFYFSDPGAMSLFLSATESENESAWYRYLDYSDFVVNREAEFPSKVIGGSVRCVYDEETFSSATLPTVTTSTVTVLSNTSAECGGEVISDGGATVTARGVCWSTSQNPTVSDNHTTDGSGVGGFVSSIAGLSDVSTYYVRAYATNGVGTVYGNEVSFITVPYPEVQPCPNTPTVTDYDGNVYNTVKIGNQCWMKENLRTTHYGNGTAIPESSFTPTTPGPGFFEPITVPLFYHAYGGNDSVCGLLYNWMAAMGGANSSENTPSGVQGVCPNGWHVPSDGEWDMLIAYANNHTQYWCGNDSLNVAKSLAGASGWVSSPNSCAVGNNPGANNALGFSALPVGYAVLENYIYGNYVGFGASAAFWSTTESYNDFDNPAFLSAGGCQFDYSLATVSRFGQLQNCGLSVRCLRDESPTVQHGQPCPGTLTVTDYDGNVYNTAQIGNQCWMKENLRTTHYTDGTAIPAGGSNTSYTQPYYYDYSSHSLPLAQRGYLYNWPAVMHGSSSSDANPSGVQGICPAGWHVPSDAEWNTMEATVSGSDWQASYETYLGWRGNHSGKLAGGDYWVSTSISGSPGNYNNADRNASGFSAVPAGDCDVSSFYAAGYKADFWSSTQGDSYYAWSRGLYYNDASVHRYGDNKYYGFSVRCLRD